MVHGCFISLVKERFIIDILGKPTSLPADESYQIDFD